MLKLCYYVPETHLTLVKEAVFAAGAGRQGNYDHCCWQALGEGQFRPLPGSKPHLGQQDELTAVTEYKVELLCEENIITTVIKALKLAHPYEEPVFDVVRLEAYS
ncbi:MAG: NGG1p interacting factor NIF3 [Porticoccaceae bacterium]|nr:NGG1p interacting factor NIF3 [Porticoccaceae bacterium]